jgi:hypothetical protein
MTDTAVAKVETQETNLIQVIERAALNPAVDVDKMQKLLEMQERIMAKNAEMSFNQAMTRLQEQLPRIKRAGSVAYKNKDSGKSEEAFKFARYEDIDGAIRPFLLAEGFSLSFNTKWSEAGAIIYGTLAHREGHSRTVEMRLPLDSSGGKNNLQGMGSTISYGKRYAVGMLLNIITVGEDDDGTGDHGEVITTEQAAELDTLLRERIAKIPQEKQKDVMPRFLKHMGVETLQEIGAGDYAKALTAARAVGTGK